MLLHEFVRRITSHPDLELVHHDESICLIRHTRPEGAEMIRLGLWAVERMCWERFVEACRVRPALQGAAAGPSGARGGDGEVVGGAEEVEDAAG